MEIGAFQQARKWKDFKGKGKDFKGKGKGKDKGGKGYYSYDYGKGKGKGGKGAGGKFGGKIGKPSEPSRRSCFGCGETGHMIKDCPKARTAGLQAIQDGKVQTPETTPTSKKTIGAALLAASTEESWDETWGYGEDSYYEEGWAFGLTEADPVRHERILFDSGCGTSVCPRDYAPTAEEKALPGLDMRTVTNEKVKASTGVIVRYSPAGQDRVSVAYRRADVSYPIISAGSVTDNNCWAILGPNGGWVTREAPVRPFYRTGAIR